MFWIREVEISKKKQRDTRYRGVLITQSSKRAAEIEN